VLQVFAGERAGDDAVRLGDALRLVHADVGFLLGNLGLDGHRFAALPVGDRILNRFLDRRVCHHRADDDPGDAEHAGIVPVQFRLHVSQHRRGQFVVPRMHDERLDPCYLRTGNVAGDPLDDVVGRQPVGRALGTNGLSGVLGEQFRDAAG
jgi:hypothetical protein